MSIHNNSVAPQGRSTSSFQSFNLSSTPLLKKIGEVFSFKLAYLTAGISYCLYNLYRAYQLKCHTGFRLDDDELKLIKCEALLDEIKHQEKSSETPQPLLQQCESLLTSITGEKKDNLLTQLALWCAKHTPNDAYRIAQQLSSYHDLLTIAESIQSQSLDFANSLSTQAFKAYVQVIEHYRNDAPATALLGVKTSLRFATIFHALQSEELKNQSFKQALDVANSLKDPLPRLNAFCEIAKSYQAMGDSNNAFSFIQSAQKLLSEDMLPVDLIRAHLGLANAFCSLEMEDELFKECSAINELLKNNDPLTTSQTLYPMAELLKKAIEAEDKKKGSKNNIESLIITLIEPVLKTLSTSSKTSTPNEQRVKAYLNIAKIYEEFLKDSVDTVLEEAFKEIKALPETTHPEINRKISFLNDLMTFSMEHSVTLEIMQILEKFYDQCPANNKNTNPLFWLDKHMLGSKIVRLYNGLYLTNRSEEFSKRHLLWVTNSTKTVFDKFSGLVGYVRKIYLKNNETLNNTHLSEQMKTLLEEATWLLSQLTRADYRKAIKMLAQAYVPVDRKKTFELLNNHENRQARDHLITAIGIPMIMGILHFYPKVGSFLALGLGLRRVFLF